MVGAVRFELTTSCTRNKRASQATLRPDPERQKVPRAVRNCNLEFQKIRAARRGGPRFAIGARLPKPCASVQAVERNARFQGVRWQSTIGFEPGS